MILPMRSHTAIYLASRVDSEECLQRATALFLDSCDGIAWFHPSPNVYRGGLKTATAIRLGAKGKLLGVKAGVPDIIIHSHRIAIELKYRENPLTPEQKMWMLSASEYGWRCYVCRSALAVLAALFPDIQIPEDRRKTLLDSKDIVQISPVKTKKNYP